MSIYLDHDQMQAYLPHIGTPGPSVLPGPGHHPVRESPLGPKGRAGQYIRALLAPILFSTRKSPSTSIPGTSGPSPRVDTGQEFYFSTDEKWMPTRQTWLHTIPLAIELCDDYELFNHINETLARRGSRVSRILSWKSHTKVHLTKVNTLLMSFSTAVITLLTKH